MSTRVCIGLAGVSFTASFWGFRQSQYQKRLQQLQQVAKSLGFGFTVVPKTFENAADALTAAKILRQKKADIVILDVATYPEGKAAGQFINNTDMPLILWSRDETIHRTNIGHNSFCGANFLAGCLDVWGRKFRHLYGTAQSRDFKARLLTAGRLIGAAKKARGSNIGLLGEGIVPKFYDIDINAENRKALLERWNIKFTLVPIKQLVEYATSYKTAKVEAALSDFAGHFTRINIPKDALEKQVRLLLAVKEITKNNGFDAIAIRCWPEFQSLYGLWPCAVVSILNDEQLPIACEGDPAGALDMLLARQLSKQASTLVDIIDWDDNNNSFSIWHCGPTACSWADKAGAGLIGHNVDGPKTGGGPKQGLPAVVDMNFRRGKVAVFRTLGAIDDEFVIQGSLVNAPKRKISGSFGAVKNASVYAEKVTNNQLRRMIFDRRLPHHYTAVRGHVFVDEIKSDYS
jgi:L-fucose isomerase-like protein